MSPMNPRFTGSRALPGLMWIGLWGFSGFFLTYSTTVPIALGSWAPGARPVPG